MFVKSFGYCVASILLLQVVADIAESDGQVIDARIVGGTVAHISTAPYLMKIRMDRRFICGGSLVASRFVVSAAHCYKGVAPRRLLVIGGATRLSEAGVKRKVVKVMIPTNFRMAILNNDVAVLKLDAQMTGTNIGTIGLYTGALNPGMLVKVSGWGIKRENGKNLSNFLRTINVPVISRSACRSQYRNSLTNTMFCASKPGTKDACSGDSGGPAVCNGKLCGIVSWGIGCARRDFPGVYTNIKLVAKFIRNCMNQ